MLCLKLGIILFKNCFKKSVLEKNNAHFLPKSTFQSSFGRKYRLMGLVLRNKIAAFIQSTKTKKAVFLVMLTTFGLVKNEYARSVVQNELKMDDLFGG